MNKNTFKQTMNLIGLKTLYIKDVIRFLRVYNQTMIAPVINAVLFFFIFTIAFTHSDEKNISYNLLLTSGLVIMSAINNAYNNGIMIVVTKITGNIVDLVTAPLTSNEIIIALAGGSVTRGILTTILVYLVLSTLQTTFPMHNFFIALFFALISSLICALIGIISGLLFDNFEESSIITNYFITPLLFLSGTFYSVTKLPDFFQKIILFNPFFYMIDGFRYGITGVSDGSLVFGPIFLIGFSGILWFIAYSILKTGYKIRK